MAGLAVPERTLDQRMSALQLANEIRSWRAEFKRKVAARKLDVATLLSEPLDARLDTMKVDELLLAIPKYGRVKVNRLLRDCAVSPSKTLGGLTRRQRLDLVRGLYGKPPARFTR